MKAFEDLKKEELTLTHYQRSDGRAADEMRPVKYTPGFIASAPGSVLAEAGRTRVIVTATIDENVPGWMRFQKVPGGWLTAEYRMLPGATAERSKREVLSVGGRTMEIQRLIGRSLRAVMDLNKLGRRQIYLDCDVIEADGGTRTASITAAWLALRMAVDKLLAEGKIKEDPLREAVAAVSVGIVGRTPLLDLCYEEDSAAETDMNVVMTASGKLIEVQGTAEETPFSRAELDQLLDLAEHGVARLLRLQQETLGGGVDAI